MPYHLRHSPCQLHFAHINQLDQPVFFTSVTVDAMEDAV